MCEFSTGRARTWKVYGPDLNGRFGGLQGTGGLEAVILDADGTTTGVINDQFGNGVATVSGTGSGASVTWNTTRVGAYGPLPGIQAQTLTDVTQVAASTAWRSRRIDPTGFYWLGARYYEPTSGRFLSADPMGQGASPSLYDFCNGDPVNFFDPDGMLGTTSTSSTTSSASSTSSTLSSTTNSSPYVSSSTTQTLSQTSPSSSLPTISGTQLLGAARVVGGVFETTAGVGLGTVTSWTGVGAVAGGAVALHGLDQIQAGLTQSLTGNQTDSLTSSGLQDIGLSQNAANLTDAGISIVGSMGAGISTTTIKMTAIMATDPLADGMSATRVAWNYDEGSAALNQADWEALGANNTTPLAKYGMMQTGVDAAGNPYQLTTTWGERIEQSINLWNTGLTPIGDTVIAGGGGALGGVANAASSFGYIQQDPTGKYQKPPKF